MKKNQPLCIVAVCLLLVLTSVAHAQATSATAIKFLPAGAPDTRQHDGSAVARARTAFVRNMSLHRPLVRSLAEKMAPSAGAASLPSVNWSGFTDVEGGANRVSSVSGQWVIPKVQCPIGTYRNQDAFIAQWVGIDGVLDGTVEQLGSATQCFEGVTFYYVWYEMFPNGTVVEGTQACINNNVDCPEPGDHITASVTVTAGGNYTLSLTDLTRPQESFSVNAACDPATCLDSSAQWIVERPALELPPPADLIQILPLVNFFRTGFSNGAVTSGGKTTAIEGFQDGPVFDVMMSDDTGSYWLDCVGQRGRPFRLLQTSDPNACPTVSPSHGTFNVTWDSSF
jgi:Peptidase A4 family